MVGGRWVESPRYVVARWNPVEIKEDKRISCTEMDTRTGRGGHKEEEGWIRGQRSLPNVWRQMVAYSSDFLQGDNGHQRQLEVHLGPRCNFDN